MNEKDLEAFRAWQRREQRERHAALYERPIRPDVAAALDHELALLGIQPPSAKARAKDGAS